MEGTKAILEETRSKRDPIEEKDVRSGWWKVRADSWRLIKRFTSGEAKRIITSVNKDNGFEAWRQLHLRFEPELEAQKNVVLVELHNIPGASTIEETKAKLVELKVRITKAEDILGER